ncbi:hypothetical protein LF296_03130 [Acinetobacter vivianii]|uniref:Fimbrial protein n=1 Tax=Acinetobacter vivianii TaxID=1776742 RepID=A0AAJ6P5T6_9GAMM|nr:fimbrial protein [Acinetobacter vivianii]WDZ51804.1 hypothetical protein LF296_03130 [Acinetobacter vivianii]
MRNLFIFLPLLALPLTSQAANQVVVQISGELIAPTLCDVTKNGDIDFGEIISSKIDGTEYKKDLGVILTCTGRNPAQEVFITLSGANASTNKLPVIGTAKGFQLVLKKNTTPQDFDSPFKVDTNGSLDLNITPEINTDAFVHGTFSAAITVKVDVV